MIALGLIFTNIGTIFWIFTVITLCFLVFLPFFSKKYFNYVKNHPSEPEVKYIIFILSILAYLANKAGVEAILPAYLVGAVLANQFIANKELIKRLRSATVALLTPFYFLKAGSLVDVKVVFGSFALVIIFFFTKSFTKFFGIFPAGKLFKFSFRSNIFTTLMMSTGLTFGTISALYGLTHNIINREQYSVLVIVVIFSAIIPTLIAQKFFYPKSEEHNNFIKSN